jgi:hypothetical protein
MYYLQPDFTRLIKAESIPLGILFFYCYNYTFIVQVTIIYNVYLYCQ